MSTVRFEARSTKGAMTLAEMEHFIEELRAAGADGSEVFGNVEVRSGTLKLLTADVRLPHSRRAD